jgi:hypothetical protein
MALAVVAPPNPSRTQAPTGVGQPRAGTSFHVGKIRIVLDLSRDNVVKNEELTYAWLVPADQSLSKPQNLSPNADYPYYTNEVRYPKSFERWKWPQKHLFFFDRGTFLVTLKSVAEDYPETFVQNVPPSEVAQWLRETEIQNVMTMLRCLIPVANKVDRALADSYSVDILHRPNPRVVWDMDIASSVTNALAFTQLFGYQLPNVMPDTDVRLKINGVEYVIHSVKWKNDVQAHEVYSNFIRDYNKTGEFNVGKFESLWKGYVEALDNNVRTMHSQLSKLVRDIESQLQLLKNDSDKSLHANIEAVKNKLMLILTRPLKQEAQQLDSATHYVKSIAGAAVVTLHADMVDVLVPTRSMALAAAASSSGSATDEQYPKKSGRDAAELIVSIQDIIDTQSIVRSALQFQADRTAGSRDENKGLFFFKTVDSQEFFKKFLYLPAVAVLGSEKMLKFVKNRVIMRLDNKQLDGSPEKKTVVQINDFVRANNISEIVETNNRLLETLTKVSAPVRRSSNATLYALINRIKLGRWPTQLDAQDRAQLGVFEEIYRTYLAPDATMQPSDNVLPYMYCGVDEVNAPRDAVGVAPAAATAAADVGNAGGLPLPPPPPAAVAAPPLAVVGGATDGSSGGDRPLYEIYVKVDVVRDQTCAHTDQQLTNELKAYLDPVKHGPDNRDYALYRKLEPPTDETVALGNNPPLANVPLPPVGKPTIGGNNHRAWTRKLRLRKHLHTFRRAN